MDHVEGLLEKCQQRVEGGGGGQGPLEEEEGQEKGGDGRKPSPFNLSSYLGSSSFRRWEFRLNLGTG